MNRTKEILNPKEEIPLSAIEFNKKFQELNIPREKLIKIFSPLQRFRLIIPQYFPSLSDQSRIWHALLYMFQLHKNQKDKADGSPFIGHPLSAALLLVDYFGVRDVELVIAELLHDSPEDQGVAIAREKLSALYGESELEKPDFEETHWHEVRKLSLQEITNKYSDQISNIISSMSNPPFFEAAHEKGIHPKIDKEAYRKLKFELNAQHVNEAIENPKVFVVKLADFCTNALHIDTFTDPEKREKYKNKYLPIFPIFIDILKEEDPLRYPIQNKNTTLKALEDAYEKVKNMEI